MFGGLKEPRAKAIAGGLVVPLVMLALVGWNLYLGCVVLPPERRFELFGVYRDFGRFWGAVTVKLGVAVACYGWFWLANDRRRERLAAPVTLAGLMMTAAGFGAMATGYFTNARA